jgi:hypothetical protein
MAIALSGTFPTRDELLEFVAASVDRHFATTGRPLTRIAHHLLFGRYVGLSLFRSGTEAVDRQARASVSNE